MQLMNQKVYQLVGLKLIEVMDSGLPAEVVANALAEVVANISVKEVVIIPHLAAYISA